MSKVEFKNFYLVNKLGSNLMLKAGYLSVKVGQFVKVLESDLEHSDVTDAINKGWLEVHSEVPDVSGLPKAPVLVVQHEQYQGMTAEELQAGTSEAAKSGATSETIGKPDPAAVKPADATSEAIGQSAEDANAGVKKGRKAADKADATPAATTPAAE